MSYDIDLKDPTTGETIELPIKHLMIGGTYKADYDQNTGMFSPMPISDAHLNITYNYSKYYYEASEGDERFFGKLWYKEPQNLGIRGIYGKSGAESIGMLRDLILRIENRYKNKIGEWISTEREESRYRDKDGNIIDIGDVLHRIINGSDDGIKSETYTEVVNEGPNHDYWKDTAANAIKPLYQLIAMAELRPDGVWDGD